METILVATDGSEHADKAVSVAGDLARMHGARILMLHTVPDLINLAIPAAYQERADAEHLQVGDILSMVGDEVIKNAQARLQDQGIEKVEVIMPSGDPAQAIVDCARTHDVDLIVMGSRGLSPFERLRLGSVSHKVSQHAPCSCLIVR